MFFFTLANDALNFHGSDTIGSSSRGAFLIDITNGLWSSNKITRGRLKYILQIGYCAKNDVESGAGRINSPGLIWRTPWKKHATITSTTEGYRIP